MTAKFLFFLLGLSVILQVSLASAPATVLNIFDTAESHNLFSAKQAKNANTTLIGYTRFEQVNYGCDVGLPLSVGISTRASAPGPLSNNPAFGIDPITRQALCKGSKEFLTCNSMCSDAFSDVKYVVNYGTAVTADCPKGYVVASCGYFPNPDATAPAVDPQSYPSPSYNSCLCYNPAGATCQAVCVKASEVFNYQVVMEDDSNYTPRAVTSTCPPYTHLLGCGFAMVNYGSDSGDWHVAPISNGQCQCYGNKQKKCYAICGSF